MNGVRTTCPYCGVGCGLVVTSAFEVSGDAEHPSSLGRLCSKGAALADTLGLEDRLLYPEIDGRRASWDASLEAVARGFAETVAQHGPEAVAFYVSGQLLTEDYYVANKLMKGFIGSANIDTNSRLCMASAVAGYKRAFGTDTVPNAYADIEQAELFVIVGANMAWCHPVLFQRIVAAKRANPAARVVVIDPRRTATCDAADLFLPLRPGTDTTLFNGLLTYLGREDAFDWAFLDAHTEGVGAAMLAAKESAESIPAVARACGLAEEAVATFYRWFAVTPRTLTLFSQGVNQSSSGTDKVNGIVNAHLATGRIGKPGAGAFSLTGQANAMGGREVGGLANQLAAHMEFTPENAARVARFWNACAVARRPGLKAVELFAALAAGRIRAVWIMCTNPVVSMPQADEVRRALRRCELVVVSDCTYTDTTSCADVLLPAAAWGEKAGMVTNSERRISRQRAFLPLPGESRPDWWIITQVAHRMGFGAAFPYRSPADIFREHARLSAYENAGSRAFDIGALAELSDAQYAAFEPVCWPLPAGPSRNGRRMAGDEQSPTSVDGPGPADGSEADANGTEGAGVKGTNEAAPQAACITNPPFADGRFFTPSGKARFVPIRPRPPQSLPDARYPLILNTGRTRDHWHTMTRTGRSARLSGHRPEPFVQVNPDDARRLGLASGDLAELTHEQARMLARVEVTPEVQAGQLFAPIHWNARFARRGRVGALIPAATDPVSGQPELKHAVIALSRYRPAWRGFVLSRRPLQARDRAAGGESSAGGGRGGQDDASRSRPNAGEALFGRCLYCVRSKGVGHWRYELAGDSPPASWPQWARTVLGVDGEWIELCDPAAGRYRGAVVVGPRLEACAFIAGDASLPDRGWLASLFDGSVIGRKARLGILLGRAIDGAPAAGSLICSCFSLRRDSLLAAILAQGLRTAEQIGAALGAGTRCGSCLPELNALLHEAAARHAVPAPRRS